LNKLVECNNLTIAYDKNIVLEKVNFEIYEGEYLCVAGENGSGKSTLIKSILGLKSPSTGSIEFFGFRKNEIGYLPQQTAVQKDFPAGVFEIALSGCLNRSGWRPFYSKEDKLLAKINLELMGVYGLRKRCFCQLSGGEQRRVLLARALCSARKLLVLDEPVSGLDPAAAREFYTTMRYINQNRHMTILMVTHDIDLALHDADRVLYVKGGTAHCSTAEEFRKSEETQKWMGGQNNA